MRLELTGYAPSPALKTGGTDPSPIEVVLNQLAGSAPVVTASAASTASAAIPAVDPGSGQVKITGGGWNVSVKGQKGGWDANEWHKLPPGKYTLALSMPRIFAHREIEIEIKPGDSQEVAAPAPATGTLSILARGSTSPNIFIDGQSVGEPPLKIVIAVGAHVVRAVDKETRETWDTEHVTVRPGAGNEPIKFAEPG